MASGGIQELEVFSREVEAKTLLKLKDVDFVGSLEEEEGEGGSSDDGASKHSDKSAFQSLDLLPRGKKAALKKTTSKRLDTADSSGDGLDI